jgi:8-oxo-dGTP diphosphatase
VAEEARVVARLGPELESVSYLDRFGRPKVARYWAMTVVSGDAAGDNEVDRAGWFALAEAKAKLSYARDRAVLDRLADLDRSSRLA